MALTVDQLGWSVLFVVALFGVVTAGATLIDWVLDRQRRPRR